MLKNNLRKAIKWRIVLFKQWAWALCERMRLKGNRICSAEEVVKKYFRPINIQHDLIRVGNNGDGGYLVPGNSFTVDALYSPGCDDKVSFELEFAERGVDCFIADGSIDLPKVNHQKFHFSSSMVVNCLRDPLCEEFECICFDDWLRKSGFDIRQHNLLQMDIEGGEFEVILGSDLVQHFSIMCIEFHELDKYLFDHSEQAKKLFSKIDEHFAIVHLHPNNTSPLSDFGSIAIPRYLEVTYVNRRCLDGFEVSLQEACFPHPLDYICDPRRPDIVLPPCFHQDA